MEFTYKNKLQTTTSISVNSNTDTADYLLLRDVSFQYLSSGFNDDNTTCSITFTFNETTPISRLGIMETNWKKFNVYYNGATANAMSLQSGQSTSTSQWISNSETSMYLMFDTIQASSITIDAYSTQVADAEKALGYVHMSDVFLDFERVPSASKYKPLKKPKEVVHRMADGSSRLQRIDNNFFASIAFKYISEGFRDSLKEVYDYQDGFVFVAFPTSTSWDEVLYPVIWPGNFDFYMYSDNASDSGFSGTIKLEEVRD